MNERLNQLGRCLETIELAIAKAQTEPDPEQREHILQVADRAATAARHEYNQAVDEDHRRPVLRLLKGGLVVSAATGGMEWLHDHMKAHGQASTAAAMAAVALTATVVYAGLDHDTSQHTPAMTTPTPSLTLPPPASAPPTTPGTPPHGAPSDIPDAASLSRGLLTPPTPPAPRPIPADDTHPELLPLPALPATAASVTIQTATPPPARSTPPPASIPAPASSTPAPPTSIPSTPATPSPPARKCLELPVHPIAHIDACLLPTDR